MYPCALYACVDMHAYAGLEVHAYARAYLVTMMNCHDSKQWLLKQCSLKSSPSDGFTIWHVLSYFFVCVCVCVHTEHTVLRAYAYVQYIYICVCVCVCVCAIVAE
jgi:hypothetical protein